MPQDWDTEEYFKRCQEYLAEIEPIVRGFYWYDLGEGVKHLKSPIDSREAFINYVHRCHNLYMRYLNAPMVECVECDRICAGWNGVNKRCNNGNNKGFYWDNEHGDDDFKFWVETYSIDDKDYVGHPEY